MLDLHSALLNACPIVKSSAVAWTIDSSLWRAEQETLLLQLLDEVALNKNGTREENNRRIHASLMRIFRLTSKPIKETLDDSSRWLAALSSPLLAMRRHNWKVLALHPLRAVFLCSDVSVLSVKVKCLSKKVIRCNPDSGHFSLLKLFCTVYHSANRQQSVYHWSSHCNQEPFITSCISKWQKYPRNRTITSTRA